MIAVPSDVWERFKLFLEIKGILRKFQTFTKSKTLAFLTDSEIKFFLFTLGNGVVFSTIRYAQFVHPVSEGVRMDSQKRCRPPFSLDDAAGHL